MASSSAASDARPEVARHDMDGLEVVRVPLTLPDFAGGRTIATVQFHATSTRDADARITLAFTGDNMQLDALGAMTLASPLMVTGVVPKRTRVALCSVGPVDPDQPVSYKVTMQAVPADPEPERVSELEGVKLFTWVTYENARGHFHFDAKNERPAPADVEVRVTTSDGDEATAPLPFRAQIVPGERVHLGIVKSLGNVHFEWSCNDIRAGAAGGKKHTEVQIDETSGVRLVQTITRGDPDSVRFVAENTHAYAVIVHVSVKGSLFTDYKGQANPIELQIPPHGMGIIGAVDFRGEARIQWGFQQVMTT